MCSVILNIVPISDLRRQNNIIGVFMKDSDVKVHIFNDEMEASLELAMPILLLLG